MHAADEFPWYEDAVMAMRRGRVLTDQEIEQIAQRHGESLGLEDAQMRAAEAFYGEVRDALHAARRESHPNYTEE